MARLSAKSTLNTLSPASNPIDQRNLKVFQEVQLKTYLGLSAWIEHSLNQHQLGLEGLRGIWVNGRQGIALCSQLRKSFPTTNIRIAPQNASLKGAQFYIQSLFSPQPTLEIEISEVSPYALELYNHAEDSTQTLLDEQSTLPTVVQHKVEPTQGKLSLLLSNYGELPLMIAEHDPIEESRILRVYYAGPHQIELEWCSLEGNPLPTSATPSTMNKPTTWRLK